MSARIFIHNAGTLPVLLELTHRLDHRRLRTIYSMKASQFHAYGGPEVLLLEEIPVPEIQSDEVLVRVHAAGLNFLDAYQRKGL